MQLYNNVVSLNRFKKMYIKLEQFWIDHEGRKLVRFCYGFALRRSSIG